MDIKFNINDEVSIKLTEEGIKHFRDHYLQFDIVAEPKVDENRWYRAQLWKIMSIFGDQMFLGNVPLVFETEIIIHTNTDK
jgi:hypothetical protein